MSDAHFGAVTVLNLIMTRKIINKIEIDANIFECTSYGFRELHRSAI